MVRSSMDDVNQYLEEVRGRIHLRASSLLQTTLDDEAAQSGASGSQSEGG